MFCQGQPNDSLAKDSLSHPDPTLVWRADTCQKPRSPFPCTCTDTCTETCTEIRNYRRARRPHALAATCMRARVACCNGTIAKGCQCSRPLVRLCTMHARVFDAEETQQSLRVGVIDHSDHPMIRGQSSKSTGSGARSNHLLLRMQARSSGEIIEMPGVPPGVFIACSFPGHSSTIARPQPPDDVCGRSI